MLKVKPKVSSLVQRQLPEFVISDHDKFKTFLSHYYAFMEEVYRGSWIADFEYRTSDVVMLNDGTLYKCVNDVMSSVSPDEDTDNWSVYDPNSQSLDIIRKTVDNFDIDSTTEQFIKLIKNNVLPTGLENATAVISDTELVKFLKELYLAKGNPDSFSFVMDKLFNIDAEVTFGKDFTFRTSDNRYNSERSMLITCVHEPEHDLRNLVGSMVYQPATNSRAFIEEIRFYDTEVVKAKITGTLTRNTSTISNVVVSSGQVEVTDVISSRFFNDAIIIESIDGDILSLSEEPNWELLDAVFGRQDTYEITVDIKDAVYNAILSARYLSDAFDPRLTVYSTSLNDDGEEETVSLLKIISKVDVVSPGALYGAGLSLSFVEYDESPGRLAKAKISQTSTGSIDEAFIFKSGTFYEVGDEFVAKSRDSSGDAIIRVTHIDGGFASAQAVMEIDRVRCTSTGYGYAPTQVINVPFKDRNDVSAQIRVDTIDGTLATVEIASGGNYRYARAMFDNGISEYFTSPVISNDSIVSVPIPNDPLVASNTTLYINGSGASGQVSLISGSPTSVTISNVGRNYVSPRIEFFSDIGMTQSTDVGFEAQFDFISVTNATFSAGEITFTIDNTEDAHSYQAGMTIDVDNIFPVVYAGQYTVSSVTSNTIVVTAADPGVAYESGGIITSDDASFSIRYLKLVGSPATATTGTVYFKVVEEFGYGVDFSLISGSIDQFTLITNGEYVESLVKDIEVDNGAAFDFTYKIKSIPLINSGMNYQNPMISVSGGIGEGFEAVLEISAGVITRVFVIDSGKNYTDDAVISATIGTGAIFVPEVIDGKIISVTVTNGGTGYTGASVVSATTIQEQATHTLNTTSNGTTTIDSVTLNTSGRHYLSAPVIEFSDSPDADFEVTGVYTIAGEYEIEMSSTAGVKVGSLLFFPAEDKMNNFRVVSIVDATHVRVERKVARNVVNKTVQVIVPRGRITAIELVNKGFGFTELPHLIDAPISEYLGSSSDTDYRLYRERAKIGIFSNTIGKVKSIKMENNGYGYRETPLVKTPIVAIIEEPNRPLVTGEWLYDSGYTYSDTEEFSDGPRAKVRHFDYALNKVVLEEASDVFSIITENGTQVVSEVTEDNIADEASFVFDASTTFVGKESFVTSKFLRYSRLEAIADSGIISRSKGTFATNSGFLSDPHIKIQNSFDIQDYSYTINTITASSKERALSLTEFKGAIDLLLHPAGHKLFSSVDVQRFSSVTKPNVFIKYSSTGQEIVASIPRFFEEASTGSLFTIKYFSPEWLEENKNALSPNATLDSTGYDNLSYYDLSDLGNPLNFTIEVQDDYGDPYTSFSNDSFSLVTFDDLTANEFLSHPEAIKKIAPASYLLIITNTV